MAEESNTNTTTRDNHPLSLFLSMLNSPESKRQYPKRLQAFFNFLDIKGDVSDQSSSFAKQYKHQDDDGEELEGRLLAFASYQKERVKKEVSPSTVPNYFKAIKLFCQANRISKNIKWKNVTKAMPRGFSAADDRAPTLEEIQKLLEFPGQKDKTIGVNLGILRHQDRGV